MTDFTKPVQTRSGLPVTIITTEGRAGYPVLGYIGDEKDLSHWSLNSHYVLDLDNKYDLINVPEKRVGYINLFSNFTARGNYTDKSQADRSAGQNRIACIRVEYTEGQFDE